MRASISVGAVTVIQKGQPREWPVCLGLLVSLSCSGPVTPLDLSSQDLDQDQRKIAAYHRLEAHAMQLRAEGQRRQVSVYERLFGPDSEWVVGARLLAQFYEEAAADQECQAGAHEALSRSSESKGQ